MIAMLCGQPLQSTFDLPQGVDTTQLANENRHKLTPHPQVFAPILSSRLLDDPLKVIAGNELENLPIHAALMRSCLASCGQVTVHWTIHS